jgi:hypothetical protein
MIRRVIAVLPLCEDHPRRVQRWSELDSSTVAKAADLLVERLTVERLDRPAVGLCTEPKNAAAGAEDYAARERKAGTIATTMAWGATMPHSPGVRREG